MGMCKVFSLISVWDKAMTQLKWTPCNEEFSAGLHVL